MKISENLGIWLRGSGVGVFSAGADMSFMYFLSKTNLELETQLYISSGVSLLIAFIGHKLWTFKNYLKGKELVKQIVFYLIWEVIFIIIITNVVIYITEPIDKYISTIHKETVKDSWILSKLVEIKDDKVQLTVLVNILIKHICIFIIFTFVSIPIYKRLFKY